MEQIISRKEARQRGLKHYFTGQLCKHGHIAIRYALKGTCTVCANMTVIRWCHEHPETAKTWRKNNKDKVNAGNTRWRSKNKEYFSNYNSIYNRKNAGLKNAHTTRRKATKLSATPKWLTKDQIKEINILYIEAINRSSTGIKYEVDHIHPLISKYICGLHVPWNLQILSKKENMIKRNSFVPHFIDATILNQIAESIKNMR